MRAKNENVVCEDFSRGAYPVRHCRPYDNCTIDAGKGPFSPILALNEINKLRVVNRPF